MWPLAEPDAWRRAERNYFAKLWSPKARALALMLLATVCIGSGNVAQVTALDSLGPFTVVMLRSTLAVILLLPFAFKELIRGDGWPPDIGICIAVAVIYFATSIVAQQVGALTTTATNIGFLINMSAVFVPMLLWITVKERPPLMAWPAALIAVIGAYLVTGAGQVSATLGDALCLLSGLLDAVWIIALSHVMPKCKSPATLIGMMYGVTSIMATGGVLFEPIDPISVWNAAPEILWLGGITSALGFLLSTKAQEHVSACVAGVVFCFEAIVSAVLGNLLLGETMGPTGLIGAAIIIAAVLILQVPERVLRRAFRNWPWSRSQPEEIPDLARVLAASAAL